MDYPKNNDVTSLILELVRLYKPKLYMEIGTQKGYTFCKVAPLVNKAVAVDTKIYPAVRLAGVNVLCWEETSDMFFARLDICPENQLDMVFIDGCHDAIQVCSDVVNSIKHVTPGTGLILVHDTYPVDSRLEKPDRCGGAWKAIKQLKVSKYAPELEILTLPGPYYGLTIIRKVSVYKHFGVDNR